MKRDGSQRHNPATLRLRPHRVNDPYKCQGTSSFVPLRDKRNPFLAPQAAAQRSGAAKKDQHSGAARKDQRSGARAIPIPAPNVINQLQRLLIELEFESSRFLAHGHDPDKCDVIVCLEAQLGGLSGILR